MRGSGINRLVILPPWPRRLESDPLSTFPKLASECLRIFDFDHCIGHPVATIIQYAVYANGKELILARSIFTELYNSTTGLQRPPPLDARKR